MFARAIDRWESYEIDIFMAGDTPDTAKPTLCMVCKSIMRAWKILEKVNSDQNLFDIRVARGQIHYSKNGKKRNKPKRITTINLVGRQLVHSLTNNTSKLSLLEGSFLSMESHTA